MTNLEPRYLPSDPEFNAWIFGVMDAQEFFERGITAYDGEWTKLRFNMINEWLTKDLIQFAAKRWKQEIEDTERQHPLPVSDRSGGSPDQHEEGPTGRSTWARQDVRDLGHYRKQRVTEPARQSRNLDSDASREFADRMASIDRTLLDAKLSILDAVGSIPGFSIDEAKEAKRCACKREHPSNHRRS